MPIALDPLLLAGICAGSALAGAWIAHRWRLHKPAGARGSERLAPTLELGPQPTSVAPGPDPELALAARPFASAIERELAEIVSGVESGAYRLMESAAQADARAAAADNLWLAVRRLRRFHDKVAAFVEPPPATEEPYEVEALLTELRRELEHARLGLEISWTLPAMLPPLLGGQEALLDKIGRAHV